MHGLGWPRASGHWSLSSVSFSSTFSPKLLPSLWQDYEYSSYNSVAYDIANHFCEMAADYHTETPHVLDYSKYPGV